VKENEVTQDLSNELDHCMGLISAAPISDETRTYLTTQSMIYAQFLSDLEAGRLNPAHAEPDTISTMQELIGVFCSQVRDLLPAKAA
jgi:hypothetical protein